jgi:hypothetical protein
MLNLSFNILCLVSSFIDSKQAVVIFEEYDKKFLYPMALKCHHHLHQLAKVELGFVDQGVDEDYTLNILDQTVNANERVKKKINKKI